MKTVMIYKVRIRHNNTILEKVKAKAGVVSQTQLRLTDVWGD